MKKIAALSLTVTTLLGAVISGCGKIQEDAVFATLDDTTITMGVANFFAKYQQATYDSFYMAYFGEDMWDNDLYGNGNTLAEDIKIEVAEDLQELYLLKAHMEEYGISITQEEEDAMSAAADEFLSSNSSGAIKQIGAQNKENVLEMLRLYTIQEKMHNRIIQDANVEVTDEEAAQRTIQYLELRLDGYTDEESNYVEYTEEEKEHRKTHIAEIAQAPAEEFEAKVEEAGMTLNTLSYGSAEDEDATLDKTVLEAADQLSKKGQISDVIETENACYVVRLDKKNDKEATEAKKEELIETRQEEYYDEILAGWKESSTWTINEKEWEKVKFTDHFAQPAEEETQIPEALPDSTEDVTEISTESIEEIQTES